MRTKSRRAKYKSEHEAAILDELERLAHGISAPFVCGGAVVPAAPVSLRFKDGAELAVSRQANVLEQAKALESLVARCGMAPFGFGRRTLYNRTVRDALQLKAADGVFAVQNFDPLRSGILDAVRSQLAPLDPNPLSAELYSLNVYGSGGHFRPHKDTPRGGDMMGSLVVCLPSQFVFGSFVVSHHGVHKVFDWAEEIRHQADPTALHWAAFFGDVDHAIQEVFGGLRVTLTYILRRGEGAQPVPQPHGAPAELLHRRLITAMADRHFLPRGGILGFPCFHMYSQEPWLQRKRGPLGKAAALKLKGRDQQIALAAMAAGLSVSLQPYLTESCADLTWQLNSFPSPTSLGRLGYRVGPDDLEQALPITSEPKDPPDFGVTWVGQPPRFNFGAQEPQPMSEEDPENPQSDEPALRQIHACEYSHTGYFGNEGGDTEFYVYAALQIAVPPLGDPTRPASGRARPAAPGVTSRTEPRLS